MSFSGGHDSSLVLAAATSLARSEGLPDPIPVTWRSRSVPAADETRWQEAVVAELGLHDWVRMETGEALDWVGPVAAAVAARHGAVYPANAHLHDPLAAEASGGSLLTGLGGDQLFSTWRWGRAADVLARRVRPTPRDAIHVALSRAPRTVRRRAAARHPAPTRLPWLTPAAETHLARRLAADAAAEPAGWRARIAWQTERRDLRAGLACIDAIGAAHDCLVAHPLVDPEVTHAIGAAGHPHGFAGRGAALDALFPALRPRSVANRRTKAAFDDVFSRDASRTAAARWSGEAVDPALVDPERLRETWRNGVPIRSALILQQFALQGRSTPVTPR